MVLLNSTSKKLRAGLITNGIAKKTPAKKTKIEAEDWPKDYKVPNLGLDKDILDAGASI